MRSIEPVSGIQRSTLSGMGRGTRKLGTVLLAFATFVALWEGYKAFGMWAGGTWPGTSIDLPVPTDDLNLPHIHDIIAELFQPVSRRSSESLLVFLTKSAWFTFKEAAVGFVIGTAVGLGLAIIMLRSKWLEKGLLPWINASQTIPLIALAPLVVTWGRSTFLSDTQAVSVIAAYLTFFPVAINGLAGLLSPAEQDIELMRSYAAPWRHVLLKVRLPASRPYLFPALRLAGSLAVIGSIVGEISAGVKGGIGRVVLDYAGKYSTGPEKLYAAVLAAAALGLFVFGSVSLAERALTRGQAAGDT